MGILFRGATDSRSLDEFTVNIPNPSDEIRNQGLEILKGWQAKSQYESDRSDEILRALQEKQKVEQQYRAEKYKLDLADNQRIAKNIEHNARVKRDNLRVKADNVGRKWTALKEIVEGTGSIAVSVGKMLEKKKQEEVDKQAAESGVYGAQDALAQYEGSQDQVNEYQAQSVKNTASKRQALKANGLRPHEVQELAPSPGRQSAAVLEGHAKAIGGDLGNFLQRTQADGSTWINKPLQIEMPDGTTFTASYAQVLQGFERGATFGGGIDKHKAARKALEQELRTTVFKNINPKHYTKYIQSSLNHWFNSHVEQAKKGFDTKAANQMRLGDASDIDSLWGKYKEENPMNPEAAASRLFKQLFYDEKPDVYTQKEWMKIKQDDFQHLIERGLIKPQDVYHMKRALILGHKGGIKGTWGDHNPEFFQAIEKAADEAITAKANELHQETQNINRAKAHDIATWDVNLSKRPPELNTSPAILQEILKFQSIGATHMVKHLAGHISIKGNSSEINKEVARRAINYRRLRGLVLERDIIRLTKHLDPSDQLEFLTEHREKGGDKSVGVMSDYYAAQSEGIRKIESFGGAYFNGQRSVNTSATVAKKVEQFKARLDEAIAISLPLAAKELGLDNPNVSSEEVHKRAIKMGYDAFLEDWKNSQDKEGGIYAFRQNKDEPKLVEYTHTIITEGAYQLPKDQTKEIYTANGTIGNFMAMVKANPNALTDPKSPGSVSLADLVTITNDLNEGKPFRPTATMQVLADSIEIDGIRGNTMGLYLSALERHQKIPDTSVKIELNQDKLKHHPAFVGRHIMTYAPPTIKAAVGGLDIEASPEGSDVLMKEISEDKPWSVLITDIEDHPNVPDYLKTDDALRMFEGVNAIREAHGFAPILLKHTPTKSMYGIPGKVTEEVVQ